MGLILDKHIEYLKSELESPCLFSHPELYYAWGSRVNEQTDWRCTSPDRYSSLRQDTSFFKNMRHIVRLLDIFSSKDEILVQCDLRGIPHEVLRFAVCYIWMSPARWFSRDWRECAMHDDSCSAEQKTWKTVESLFYETSAWHLPIIEVDDFINLKLDAF